jgi:hypothetical protein
MPADKGIIQGQENEQNVKVPAADTLRAEAVTFSELDGVKDILEAESSRFSFTKKAYAIDKGHIRDFDRIKQAVVNVLLHYPTFLLKNMTSVECEDKIKDSMATIGENISPGDEKVFMPLLADENTKFNDWIPVKLNIEEINKLPKDKKKIITKRHNLEKNGLFERKKIKFSNFDLNTDATLLEDKTKGGKKTKALIKATLRSRTIQKKFNKEYGRDEEDIEADDRDNSKIKNSNDDLEKTDYGKQIKRATELGKEYLEGVLKFGNIKFGVPFIKLTPKGLLMDFMSAVNIQNKKATARSSVIIKFGKTFSVNYLGTELKSADSLEIGSSDTILMTLGFSSMIHDPSQNDSLFTAENFNISASGMNGSIKSNMTANKFTYHTINGFSIDNGKFTIEGPKIGGSEGQIEVNNLLVNENKIKHYNGEGTINKVSLTSHLSAENISVVIDFNEDQYIIDGKADVNLNGSLSTIGLEDFNLTGTLNIINDSSIDNLKYVLKNGNLSGKFLLNDEQNKIELVGVSYNSENPNQIKANFFEAKNFNLYGYLGNLTILKPEINNSGFNFDLTAGKIQELSVGKFLNLKNIKVYISKIGQNYSISAKTNLKFNALSLIPGFESDTTGGGELEVNRSETGKLNYAITNGHLNSTILDNTFSLKGVEYDSTIPSEVSAEEAKWKGNVYSKDISVTITNPKIDDQKGFTFDTATGKISELNLSNVLKLQNIEVSVEQVDDNYELMGESDVKVEEIKGLKILGKEVEINKIGGKVKYNSHNDNKISAEGIYINVSIKEGNSETTIDLKKVNITKDGNLSVEEFTANYTDTKLNIDQQKLTGAGVSFENSELTFEYLKASGLGIKMTAYDFLTAYIHSIKVYNKNKKAIEIGFSGSVKKVFQEGPGEDKSSGFDAKLGGIIGWDFNNEKKFILKIKNMSAKGSVKNPLNNLGDLIKEFSSGRVDIGASIPVFPGIFAEFGFFLEAAMKLGGGNLVFSADLNSEKNQIHLTMEPVDIANGYIAAGVYAGIKAGSKFLVAVSVYLEALGKASVTSGIDYKSILDFNDPKSLKFIHQQGSFYGFGYSLEAEMKFAAQLKAITQALYFFKKEWNYPLADKTIGKFKYSSEKPEGDFDEGDVLVEEKEFKTEVKDKYKNKTIKELLKLNSETDFSGSESTIANKFTNKIAENKAYEKNIGEDLNVKEKKKVEDDRLGERYHKRYLVNIRKLNSRLTNLNNISDFQYNRFPKSSFTSDLASKETNEEKESFVKGIKSHKAYNDKHSLILKSFSTHKVLESGEWNFFSESAMVSLGLEYSVEKLQSAHIKVKENQDVQIEKLKEIVKFKDLKAIDMTEEKIKSFRESLLVYHTKYNQGDQASENLKSKIRNEERSFNAGYYKAKTEEIANQFKEQKLESKKKPKESNSYLSDDFSANYKKIQENKMF